MSLFRIHHYNLLCKNHINMLRVHLAQRCAARSLADVTWHAFAQVNLICINSYF